MTMKNDSTTTKKMNEGYGLQLFYEKETETFIKYSE